MLGDEIALGPGRVDLLELVEETGSLRAAAQRMGMSYMRAWHLAKYTNRSFSEPVLEVTRGGTSGGGAKLTPTGRRVVALYREIEEGCLRAGKSSWTELQKLLGNGR
jgi:molybdate transport system regulatory protein